MSVIFNHLLSHSSEIKKTSGILFLEHHYNYERFIIDIQAMIKSFETEKVPSRFIFWHGKDYYALLCLFFACMQTKKILLPGLSLKLLAEAAEHIPFTAVFENFHRTDIETHLITDGLSDFSGGGLLLPTSGTTSIPRWALLSEKMLYRNALTAIDFQQLNTKDRILAFSSLAHTGGWNINLLPGLLAGSNVHLIGRFSPYQSLKLIQSNTAVKTHLSPPQINLWENLNSWENADLRSIKTLVTGSSEVWPHIAERLLNKGVEKVLRNYGLTEVGPMVFCETVASINDDLESYGTLTRGLKVLLDNEHRLLVQGGHCFQRLYTKRTFNKIPVYLVGHWGSFHQEKTSAALCRKSSRPYFYR